MSTVQDIFDKWGSASDLARAIGLKRASHGTLMKCRGSIPQKYWPRLVEASKDRGIEGITYESLALAHAQKANSSEALA